MRFIEQNQTAEKLLQGDAGTYAFCRNCEEYENCNHDGQKILTSNKIIIDYAYQIEGGFNSYYWGDNLYEQPEWFIFLLNKARSEIQKIRKDKNANRKSKN